MSTISKSGGVSRTPSSSGHSTSAPASKGKAAAPRSVSSDGFQTRTPGGGNTFKAALGQPRPVKVPATITVSGSSAGGMAPTGTASGSAAPRTEPPKSLATGQTINPTLQNASPAQQAWANGILKQDAGAGATLHNILTPGGTLNTALTSAGIDPLKGQSAGKPPPAIPFVQYTVTKDQLAALEKQFPLDTKNAYSEKLGQSENRGVLTNEAYSPDSKTLWRMAVEPQKDGTYKVGFYGERLPSDAQGQGMYLKAGGSGVRAGGDTRVGSDPAGWQQALDDVARGLNLTPTN